ncbi:MAG: type II toxin-antitoxin system RelE/ParE family toxin [Azospira sp.]|jgi:mRNA-degrading endonuclease RelE of RelBE toxin-antitoxin system|nr:type II toxin-antitoxin system RelE/ParE family toxin [Azospira sp.]
MNEIHWKPKAVKQLRKVPEQDNRRIRTSVTTELSDLTQARQVKALTNHACGYRLRVGDYRVFFNVMDGAVCVVSIEEVRKRDERTY